MTQKIKPEILQAFFKRCVSVRTFVNSDDSTIREHCLSVNLNEITNFYISCIGVPPMVQSVEEIEECLKTAVEQARRTKPEGYLLVVRLYGDCKPWLAIKIYTMLVYLCDRIVYSGDILIRL